MFEFHAEIMCFVFLIFVFFGPWQGAELSTIVIGGATTAFPLELTMNHTDRTRSGFSRETEAYKSKLTSRIVTDRLDAGTESAGTV